MPRLSFLSSASLLSVLVTFGATASVQKPLAELGHQSAASGVLPTFKALQMKSLASQNLLHRAKPSVGEFARFAVAAKKMMSRLENTSRQQMIAGVSVVREKKLSTRQNSIEKGAYDECPIKSARALGTSAAEDATNVIDILNECIPCLNPNEICPSTCCGILGWVGPSSVQGFLCKLEGW